MSDKETSGGSESGMNVTLTDDGVNTLFGVHDENLRMIEDAFGVRISARGTEILVRGDESVTRTVGKLLTEMETLIERCYPVGKTEIATGIRLLSEDPEASIPDFFLDAGNRSSAKRLATPRNMAQKRYLQRIEEHDMTFSLGPAGTGKTFLAVAVAAAYLNAKLVKRIILCRPAVEAGEKLGFLPVDLAEKVNPYLRPLYDSLYDIIGFETVSKLLERNIIEIAPLAFMRGRTLAEAFIILDEAQNTTPEQMKMFLTRIGFGSKAVITGDITQTDLPEGKRSGLREVIAFLKDVEGISVFEFSKNDVVRHPLVGRIVTAYDIWEEEGRRKRKSDDD